MHWTEPSETETAAARSSGQELSKQLNEARAVDVMVAVGPSRELACPGGAETDETGCLCRMVAARKDLAVHGMEGGQVNSYYFDPHDDTNRFNFVRAICLVSPSVPNETSVRSPQWAGR